MLRWLLLMAATITTTFIPNPAGIASLLQSPVGTLGMWLQRKTNEVELVARAECPKDSGALTSSHESRVIGPPLIGQVSAGGDNAPYAVYVHEGTKGPYDIVAKNSPVLVFPSRRTGAIVFTPRVSHPGIRSQQIGRAHV